MKSIFIQTLLVASILVFSTQYATAVQVSKGTVTQIAIGYDTQSPNVGTNFSVYINSIEGCPSNWYYAYKGNMDADTWEAVLKLALIAYEQGKTVSIFESTSDCNQQTFQSMQTW